MKELAETGVLGLIHAHQISLGNMRRLSDWHAERLAAFPIGSPIIVKR